MNKIILKDGTILEFNKIEGLAVTFTDKTVDDLEKVFKKENCSKIQLAKENGAVYGIYNNLECVSVIKYGNETVTVNLQQINDLVVKVEQLQATVDTLVVSGLEG